MPTATATDYYVFFTRYVAPIMEYAAGKYKGLCPLHGDTDPSFDVDWHKGMWFCHGACKRGGNAVQLAKALNVPLGDVPGLEPRLTDRGPLSPPPPSKRFTPPVNPKPSVNTGKRPDPWKEGKIVAEYPFTDEKGEYLFHEVRFEPKDFRLAIKNGNGWVKSLESLGERKRTLYRLPEFQDHTSEYAWICEGPKDVDRMISLGFRATTCPMGSGSWHGGYGEYLRGSHVIVPIDNDEAGEKFGAQVLASAQGKALSTRILRLPGIPVKGDISDWLDQGHTPADLLELIQGEPEQKPGLEAERGTSIIEWAKGQPDETWLVDRIIPEKAKGFLAGHPKVGKTWIAYLISICVAIGRSFLDEHPIKSKGPCLIIEEESSRKNIGKRLHKLIVNMNLDEDEKQRLDDIHVVSRKFMKIPRDAGKIVEYVKAHGIKLVILDSLRRVHTGKEKDSDDMQPVLEGLDLIQVQGECSVLVIHHLRKDTKGDSNTGFEAMRGSGDLYAWADYLIGLKREGKSRDKSIMHFEFREAEETPRMTLSREPMADDGIMFLKTEAEADVNFSEAVVYFKKRMRDAGEPMYMSKILDRAHEDEEFKMRNTKRKEVFDWMIKEGIVTEIGKKWELKREPEPEPEPETKLFGLND